MSPLYTSRDPAQTARASYPRPFVRRPGSTSPLDTLLSNVDPADSRISRIIDTVLTAAERCEVTSLYVQGMVVGDAVFLTTNLNAHHQIQVTARGSNWLIGRSKRCAISVPHPRIAPFHAAVGYCSSRGFYLVDVGSSLGTWVNRRPLATLQRRKLHNGDLLDLGDVRVEFFIDVLDQMPFPLGDETYC